jgi:hypothetical protein
MTGGRVVPLNPDAHAAVQVLLPWYVTGHLDADEHAQVEAHLAGCSRCQAELESERRLRDAHLAMETPGDAERALDALRSRIAPKPAIRPPAPRRGHRRWFPGRVPNALRAVLAVQFAVIVALGGALLVRPAAEPYRLLGETAVPGNVIVKFRADATEQDIRRALRASGGRLVDGPTSSDAYLLAVPAAQEPASLERLRAEPVVLLAESLAPGGTK